MVLDDEDAKKIAERIIETSPTALVSSTILFGIPLSEWVYIATIIYTFVGICTLIKRYWVDPYLRYRRRLLAIQEEINREKEFNNRKEKE